jgi:hypothetical protein
MSESDLPASNSGRRSGDGVRAGRSQGSIADGSTSGDGSRELKNSKIVVLPAVARVNSDGGKPRGNTTRSARLSKRLVRQLLSPKEWTTYKTASTDLETALGVSGNAVGSGQDGVGVEERASAPRATVAADAHDEGKVASAGRSATNDVGDLLRSGSGQGSNKCNDGSELDHGEEVDIQEMRVEE